ncbi:MAG: ABC transporter ATP-binding protein, partial [Mesorhizobium sp.]
MGSLNIENVKKAFGPVEVLKGINLEVTDGEFVVFVGPSGCGKSTLLRVIAGLEDSTSGRVVIDGADVSATPPAKRGIAMVFQTYALYPHLTVKNNMGLGLKQAGTPAAEIDRRIGIASSMLSLEPYLSRRPAELSGGQRQRVAIGRAVVREPKLFLFDEPLSNLDAALRVNTRLEIAQLHRRLKATMIYVTHDQVEAMTLADKIVVLNAGKIEQIGGPMELYNSPANEFVAGFIGSPKMNFVDGARLGETAKTIGVRPEHLTVDAKSGTWKGTVVHA